MENDFYNNKENIAQYIKMAEGYNGKHIIDTLENHIPNNASVLELGSGPGTDWAILNERFDVTGSDFSEEFLSLLRRNNPNSDFLTLDASTLKTDKKFDAIYSNKVLHHLNDEELKASIKRQALILNADGILCHSFWKGEGTESYEGMFVNNHTIEELESLLSDKFEIISLEEYQEFDANDSIYLIAKKR